MRGGGSGKPTPETKNRGAGTMTMTEQDETETVWFSADAELVEELARNAKLRNETLGEYVFECCQRYDDSIGENQSN